MTDAVSFAVVVPTLNAGPAWQQWIDGLKSQSATPDKVLIVDSSSNDATADIAAAAGYDVLRIERKDFNHGTTRQLAAERLGDAEIIVYLTQDAILADQDALKNLLSTFADPSVAIAYGRQLPHRDAKPIGAHARIFNYTEKSEVKSANDISRLGLKVAFVSNSFAAYRRAVLMSIGGFPSDNIFGEDTYVSAKVILAGLKVAYVSDAKVFHSHDYSVIQDFQRYFDIGVFHSREPWLRSAFGGAEGEGKRFVVSELRFLMKNAIFLIPSSMFRTLVKYVGYRMGLIEHRLSKKTKLKLSMHKGYWS